MACRKSYRDSTKKATGPISEFSKVAGYKFSIWKSTVFSFTCIEQVESENKIIKNFKSLKSDII